MITPDQERALQDVILGDIKTKITQIIKSAAEEAAQAAAGVARKRVGEMAAKAAVDLTSNIQFERMGLDLRITIRLPQP